MMLEQLYLARMDLSLHSVYKTDAAQTILTHRLEVQACGSKPDSRGSRRDAAPV